MTKPKQQLPQAIPMRFPFERDEIRVKVQAGLPWFCATDLARILKISNTREFVRRLDEDELQKLPCRDCKGRQQVMNFVSESGVYALVLRTHQALEDGSTAHRFRGWIRKELLPDLRKRGLISSTKRSGVS